MAKNIVLEIGTVWLVFSCCCMNYHCGTGKPEVEDCARSLSEALNMCNVNCVELCTWVKDMDISATPSEGTHTGQVEKNST